LEGLEKGGTWGKLVGGEGEGEGGFVSGVCVVGGVGGGEEGGVGEE